MRTLNRRTYYQIHLPAFTSMPRTSVLPPSSNQKTRKIKRRKKKKKKISVVFDFLIVCPQTTIICHVPSPLLFFKPKIREGRSKIGRKKREEKKETQGFDIHDLTSTI